MKNISVTILFILFLHSLVIAQKYPDVAFFNHSSEKVLLIKKADTTKYALVIKSLPNLTALDSIVLSGNYADFSNDCYISSDDSYVVYNLSNTKCVIHYFKDNSQKIINYKDYLQVNAHHAICGVKLGDNPNELYLHGTYGTIKYFLNTDKIEQVHDEYIIMINTPENKIFGKPVEYREGESVEVYYNKYFYRYMNKQMIPIDETEGYDVFLANKTVFTRFQIRKYDYSAKNTNGETVSLEQSGFLYTNKNRTGFAFHVGTNSKESVFLLNYFKR